MAAVGANKLCAVALASGLLLAALPAGGAGDSFTDRCIELNARLAKLDCKQAFAEARALLVDAKPYLSDVAQELKRNKPRLEALSAALGQTSKVAMSCVAKHVKEAPAVTPAYLGIDHFQAKLQQWVHHRWEFPADFARTYQRDLMEKYNDTLEALRAAGNQL